MSYHEDSDHSTIRELQGQVSLFDPKFLGLVQGELPRVASSNEHRHEAEQRAEKKYEPPQAISRPHGILYCIL